MSHLREIAEEYFLSKFCLELAAWLSRCMRQRDGPD
jgi:hypothetical protein